jgi:hypothetical protein
MTSQLAQGQAVAALPTGRGRGPGGPPARLPLPAGRCPVPGCGDQTDRTRLMCRRDWYLVPKAAARPGVGDLALRTRSCQPRAPGGSADGDRRLPRRPAARPETPAHPVPARARSRPAP